MRIYYAKWCSLSFLNISFIQIGNQKVLHSLNEEIINQVGSKEIFRPYIRVLSSHKSCSY